MNEFFADLHVHIGRAENNKPIKITAAKSLNFANIAKECEERKGINIVGIIDCASKLSATSNTIAHIARVAYHHSGSFTLLLISSKEIFL